jgi:hypothetical protein
VAGVAGYVLGASGRRYVLVAIANHPNAKAQRGLHGRAGRMDRTRPLTHLTHVHYRSHRLPGRRPDHLQLCAPGLADLSHPDVSGISLGMYSVFTLGVALWLVYGLLLEAWPIVAANAVTLALASGHPGHEAALSLSRAGFLRVYPVARRSGDG